MKKTANKKIAKLLARKFLAILIVLGSNPAIAAIPYKTAFENMDIINSQTKELNLELLARIQIIVDGSRFNMANYIPTQKIQTDDSEQVVMNHIFKQTLKTLLDTEDSATSAGLQKIENLNTSLSSTIDRNGHSFSFRLKAIETKAEINYKGYVSATVAFDANNSESSLEVSKNVGSQTYAFTHTNNNDGYSDIVGVRWAF